ncbi:hypothetical protein HDU89_001150 [Geranomyces variabilis]|nr:hypothetical protein HDU89_001150 [Geranomyces variabilis]
MATLYTKNISLTEVSHGKGIVATETIPANSVLSINLLIFGTLQDICAQLMTPDWDNVRNSLYPRRGDAPIEEIVMSNTFDSIEPGKLLLGHYLSFYNHSCKSNAMRGQIRLVRPGTGHMNFMVVIALREIKAGEEITLFYGAKFGHNSQKLGFHDFKCNCTLTDNTIREEKETRLLKKGMEYIEKHSNDLMNLLLEAML